jgi:hypothetical protein
MTHSEDLAFPFKDEGVRQAWLDVLMYLEDDEFVPYKDWLQVAKDSAFDVLCEEGFDSEYAFWVSRLRAEEMFLNRRALAREV